MVTAKMTLRRLEPMSLAKIMALGQGIIGLLAGAIFALVGMLGAFAGSALGGRDAMGGAFGMLFGIGAVIFMPLLYAVIGFVSGLIGAVIYNFLAGRVGGMRWEVEVQQQQSPPPAYPPPAYAPPR